MAERMAPWQHAFPNRHEVRDEVRQGCDGSYSRRAPAWWAVKTALQVESLRRDEEPGSYKTLGRLRRCIRISCIYISDFVSHCHITRPWSFQMPGHVVLGKPRTMLLQLQLQALRSAHVLEPSARLEACRKVARRAEKLNVMSAGPGCSSSVAMRRGRPCETPINKKRRPPNYKLPAAFLFGPMRRGRLLTSVTLQMPFFTGMKWIECFTFTPRKCLEPVPDRDFQDAEGLIE